MKVATDSVLSQIVRTSTEVFRGLAKPQCEVWNEWTRLVAATVIITGRIRSMPASGRARSSGSPFFVPSPHEVESTMTWLTMTPMRLATPRNAIEAKRRAHDCQRN